MHPRRLARLRLFMGVSLASLTLGEGHAAAQISGAVRDATTGLPVAGARVRLQATKTETVSDAAGAFSLPGVTGSAKVIVAAKQGFYYASAKVTAPRADVVLALAEVTGADDPAANPTPATTCGSCHASIYKDWASSPMGRAGKNTWVYDVYDGTGTPGGAGGFVYKRDSLLAKKNPASECASCHQPELWWKTPYAAMDPLASNSGPVEHGVSCDMCHKIASIDSSKPNFPGLWPGVVKLARPGPNEQLAFGVLGDVTYELPGSMKAAYNPQLRADVCAACHQDKNDPDENGDFESPRGVISEPTYLEWKDSPYANPSDPRHATCVDCHMKPTGEGQACSVQLPPLQRPPGDVRSHTFPGTTPEFLENAVTLRLVARRSGPTLEVDVAVHNDKTGHHVPTGVTIRNVVLLVEAYTTKDGAALVHTGKQVVHELGGVGDPKRGYYAGLPGKLFAKVNGDVNGKGPTFFTDATSILWDSRIPPLATDTTHYTFTIPPEAGQLGVRARAIYRRSWRALVDAKKWDKDAYGSPLEDVTAPHYGHLMEQAEQTLDAPCLGAACADAGTPEAGAPDAATPGAAPPASPPSDSGCGCRAVDGGDTRGSLAALLGVALVGLGAARRRAREARRGGPWVSTST